MNQTHDSLIAIFCRDADRYSALSPEDEADLAALANRGDAAARDRLVGYHLPLAMKYARQHARRHPALDLADLIGEANVGLVRAADTFRPGEGYRFATHAIWHITDSLRVYAAAAGGSLPISVKAAKTVRDYREAEATVRQALGRDPSFDEVCDAMKLQPSHRREMAAKLAASRRGVSMNSTPALDRTEDGPDGLDLPDLGPDHVADIEAADLVSWVAGAMARMDDEEVEIIRRRFGIGFERPQSRKAVADAVGYHQQTIGSIERAALRRLGDLLDVA